VYHSCEDLDSDGNTDDASHISDTPSNFDFNNIDMNAEEYGEWTGIDEASMETREFSGIPPIVSITCCQCPLNRFIILLHIHRTY
jgi:hypothetical protein